MSHHPISKKKDLHQEKVRMNLGWPVGWVKEYLIYKNRGTNLNSIFLTRLN
jgi:hypothetical protein